MKLFDSHRVALADEETISVFDLRKPELQSFIVHQSELVDESSSDEKSVEIIDFHFNQELCEARNQIVEEIK